MFTVVIEFKFPSPYGVSFILIYKNWRMYSRFNRGFRLLTEYHSFLLE